MRSPLLPVLSFSLVAILLGLLTSPGFAAAGNLLAGRRTLVLGDSITQDGRYVTLLEYYLHRLAPDSKADLISIGLGSETVSGLSEPGHPFPRPNVLDRLGQALKLVKPQVVLACYGMNDGIYHPPSPERLAAYNTGLEKLREQVSAAGASLVLITPPVFDPGPIAQRIAPADAKTFGYQATYGRYDDVLAEFAASALRFRQEGSVVIDLHSAMAAELAARRTADPKFTFSPDGIHPGEQGHLLIARLLARGIGLTPPEGDLPEELGRIKADPLFPLVRDRRALRSEAWLAFVGYTRGPVIKSASITAAETVAARLQTEIEALAAKSK